VIRPSWDQYFLLIAKATATRATCDRKHVGAVIADIRSRIIATGYNGSPAGLPHCDDEGHELKEIDGRMSCIRTLHAESNALDRAGQASDGCTLYVTVIPCYECAKRIINAGISRVVYAEYYQSRNTDLVKGLFEDAGVVIEYQPLRFTVGISCAHDDCPNTARYDSGLCGVHDKQDNDGNGKRIE